MVTAYRVTLKYADGTTMFVGTVHAEPITQNPAPNQPAPNGGRSADDGEKATAPQIKALYAIIRRKEKLTDNQDISKRLRDHFKVRRLDEVPREAATAYIRQHQPEGGRGNSS